MKPDPMKDARCERIATLERRATLAFAASLPFCAVIVACALLGRASLFPSGVLEFIGWTATACFAILIVTGGAIDGYAKSLNVEDSE